MFELTVFFNIEKIGVVFKTWSKLRIKWNFELTVFELAVPDLYSPHVEKIPKFQPKQNTSVNKKVRLQVVSKCLAISFFFFFLLARYVSIVIEFGGGGES